MYRFFSGVSSIALLLCLTTQTVFSMTEKEEDNSARGAAATYSSNQGILGRASRAPNEKNVTLLVGTTRLMASIPQEAEVVCHYTFSNYTPDNYFKFMDVTLPQLLIRVESLKGKISPDQFLRLCNGYLEKVAFPFKLYIKDASTLLVMMSGGEDRLLVISTPAARTQETTSDVARAPVEGPLVSQNVPIIDCLRISKKVCHTRARLLELRREALDGTKEEGCLKEEIESYKKLLAYISQFDPQIKSPATRLLFLNSQYAAHQDISNLLEKLGHFYLLKDQIEAYIGTISARSESLSYCLKATYQLLESDPINQVLISSRSTLIDNLYSLSIVEYGYYLGYDAERTVGSYDRALAYNRQLKEIGERDLYTKNQKHLDDMKVKTTSLSLRGGPRLGGVVSALRQFELEKSGDPFYCEHHKFSSFMRESLKNKGSLSEQTREIQAQLVDFENKMIGRKTSSLLSSLELDSFYQKYKKALRGRFEELENITNLLIEFFMRTEQLEQSINHIVSFKKVYGETHQTKTFKEMDLTLAILKALQGDSEEFLSLIEDAQKASAERDLERSAQKAERDKRRNKIIKAAVAAVERETQKRLTSTKPQPSKNFEVKLTPEIPVSSSSLFEINISPVEEKKKREERHQQSAARKEEERRKREEREDEMRQERAFQHGAAAAAEEDASEDVPLEEKRGIRGVYVPFDSEIRENLKTSQRRLEDEMEAGTWNFTRKELQKYYEDFGCEIRQPGTSHVKAALPKFEKVLLPDGTPLVINFNFEGSRLEGGAFGFGEWTDTVPRYLRPQILEARRRIQAFKLFVNKEVRRALAEEDEDDDE